MANPISRAGAGPLPSASRPFKKPILGRQRVDLTRSLFRRGMFAVCANETARIDDVEPTLGSPGLALFVEALRYRSQF
jgi:hypothetical protein